MLLLPPLSLPPLLLPLPPATPHSPPHQSNRELGLQYQNGPLESGWAVAAMAKALELLREVPGWDDAFDNFMAWTDAVTMPSMDFYVFNISAPAIIKGVPHV